MPASSFRTVSHPTLRKGESVTHVSGTKCLRGSATTPTPKPPVRDPRSGGHSAWQFSPFNLERSPVGILDNSALFPPVV